MNETAPTPQRAVLVAAHLDGVTEEEFAESLRELGQLAKTLGAEVAGQVTQRRAALDPGACLGPGKLEELKVLVEARAATLVLVDHELTPSQARNLEKASGVAVHDRTAVILDIFHRHARSREARAQVEMVRLQYLAPRLREQAAANRADKQRGGAVGRSAGESGVELDRRKIRDRIAVLREELERIAEEQQTRRARRRGQRRVALVGYTNAGKSTLMRALTGSDVLVADKLFATLDTTVRALQPEARPPVLVSDTVGFLRRLPHELVASFRSTLDEALEASLLLHVVDVADPAWPRQLAAADAVLGDIGAGAIPRLVLFNKADKVGDAAAVTEARREHPEALVVSAKLPEDVARVRAAILAHFDREAVEVELAVPWSRQELRADIHARCEVLGEEAGEDGAVFRVRAPRAEIDQLRARIAEPRRR